MRMGRSEDGVFNGGQYAVRRCSFHKGELSSGMAFDPFLWDETLHLGLFHVWQLHQDILQVFFCIDATALASP